MVTWMMTRRWRVLGLLLLSCCCSSVASSVCLRRRVELDSAMPPGTIQCLFCHKVFERDWTAECWLRWTGLLDTLGYGGGFLSFPRLWVVLEADDNLGEQIQSQIPIVAY